MNTEKQPKALADHIADASKMVAPSTIKQLADSFPELNHSNYGAEDVDKLHNWALEVVQAITALDHAAAPVVWPEPFALYDGEKWHANEEAAICSCATMQELNIQKLQKVFTEQQVRELLAQATCHQAQPVKQEPFGYFKPFVDGWMDCKETDEGARPLYEAPQPQADATTPQGLRECCEHLNAAGHAFWAACALEADGGAVRWVKYADGSLIVFTRGEYKDQLLSALGGLYSAPTKVFEHHSEEFERETQAFEATDKKQADARDAERYRLLRDEWLNNEPEAINMERARGQRGLDAAIDAAIAAAKEK